MKKLKKYYVPILFFVLGIIVVFPLTLTIFNKNLLLNKINIVDVPEDVLYLSQRDNSDFNTIEKLKIYLKATIEKNGIVTETRDEDLLNDEETETLVNRIKEQVEILKDKDFLTGLDMSGEYETIYLTKTNYMDSLDPTNYLSVWNVVLAYDDFEIGFSVDTQTFLIYQFTLYLENQDVINYKQLKPERFFEYVGLSFNDYIVKPDKYYGKNYIFDIGEDYSIKYHIIQDEEDIGYWAGL